MPKSSNPSSFSRELQREAQGAKELERAEKEYRQAWLEAREAFEAGFQRSKKGNLWRVFDGVIVCVFRRPFDGLYGWSIAGTEEVTRFSKIGYESKEVAIEDLFHEVGGY